MERWESKPTEMGRMVNWELKKRTQCAKQQQQQQNRLKNLVMMKRSEVR